MCGIFGYVGFKDRISTLMEGLKNLEYRGYDSAGVAGFNEANELVACKVVGKVDLLEQTLLKKSLQLSLGIAQTRWATHGSVSEENAHPHFDAARSLALVHNGIIENHEALRQQLIEEGVTFLSDTDTEVVAHLISKLYAGDLLKAVQKAVAQLKGSYALALVHVDFPDQVVAVAHQAPLVIGIGSNEAFISSDPHAFAFHTQQAIYLSDSEIAIIRAGSQEIYNAEQRITKTSQIVELDLSAHCKGSYEHYTLKEIHEQPQTIKNCLLGRFLPDYGTAIFEELSFNHGDLLTAERILILACGTSWHAGFVAAYMIEEKARIPVQVEISSEFRYKSPIILPGTLVVALSQSGETADTIAAVREVKAKGARVIAICNIKGSTLCREADSTIYLKAGSEIGVCSTKAFTNQVVILSLFALMMARMRHMNKSEGQSFLQEAMRLPEQVQKILDQSASIEALAKRYAHYENFFYLGRCYMYPSSLEGALKLKEISYINANGYPAGEMKHGPIALINEECPTVALCANEATFEKLLSNLMEIKSRGGKIIAVAFEGEQKLDKIVTDIFKIPLTADPLAPVLVTVFSQLFAYYVAKERGAEIDQPRNLAKSVTVE